MPLGPFERNVELKHVDSRTLHMAPPSFARGSSILSMQITKISVYRIDVPIKPATVSHDRVMSVFDETIVRIETDAGVDGWPTDIQKVQAER